MANFLFKSIYVEVEEIKHTETRTWIGKNILISVSIAQSLVETPIFFCEVNPCNLVSSFVDIQENLATQNKIQMKNKFMQIETTIRNKLTQILALSNQRRTHIMDMEEDSVEDNSDEVSKLFQQMQNKQLFDLKCHFDR